MQTNLLQYLDNQALLRPEAVAFEDEKEQITFGGLLDAAGRIGSFLIARYGLPHRPVAVITRRNVRSLVSFFGILSGGTCYVPLDAEMPRKRMDSVLEQLRPACILYNQEDEALARELSQQWEIADYDSALAWEMQPALLEQARARTLDIDPAYILFTSGSTGVPKGILVSHRSVIDFTEWYAGITGVTAADRLGNQAPFFFDLSVKDVYLTLKTGACTVILPKKCFLFPVLLMKALDQYEITTLSWATSAFHLVASSGVLEKYVPHHLKRVLLGGEALQAKILNRWRKVLPQVRYVNLYGPTEVTVDCTWYPIEKEFADTDRIPIGKACANMEVFLLKEDNTPALMGEEGEICVRGSGLAIGYFADPEKTAKAFVQNPLNPEYPDRIYRTGDFGRLDEDGNIIFIARSDDQIKHMGYRIELGELETALYATEGIQDVACLFDRAADKIICIYQGTPDQDSLAQSLRTALPKYMVPNIYVKLDAMPHNANGKIDRAKLKKEYLG